MVNDPIADFLIRIKNAHMAGHASVSMPYSKMKMAIAKVLEKAGYIKSADKSGKGVRKTLYIELQHKADGTPRITEVKRISKPGCRIYIKSADIHPVRFGKGDKVLSTPAGIMLGRDAKKKNVGGELLFEIH